MQPSDKRFKIADRSENSKRMQREIRYEGLKYIGIKDKVNIYKTLTFPVSRENDLKIIAYINQLAEDIKALASKKQKHEITRCFDSDYFGFDSN